MTQASWLDWDGRTLRWQCAAPSSELVIDGVVFEPCAASDGIVAETFDYSPTGDARIEFSLRAADDAILLPAWRVVHGEPAMAGAHAWQGAATAMRSIVTPVPITDARKPVAIVVPIFNAPALVERCIESVIRWTSSPARLILIDDASDDPAIAPLLKKYTLRQNVTMLRNSENLGYTRTSNLGIEMSGGADVVLLNSDTHVGPRWLDRLRQIAYSDASVGTVTAVSDNAGAFSVPDLERYCPIPPRWTLPQTQRALLQRVASPPPQLPTGNGFCMYIKRAMLDAVGVLDADAFPSGYGEENDLCQRGVRAGFRHLIAGDVFVAHARSASFGDERRARLGGQGMAVLRQRYPDYERDVGATLYSFARRVLDYRVRRIYADAERVPLPRPRMLAIASNTDAHIAASRLVAFECIRAFDSGTLRTDGNVEIADDESLCAWLVEHAIEYVVAAAAAPTKIRWRSVAASLAIAFIEFDTADFDFEAAARRSWNAIAAFGQSPATSSPNSCL
ncbi:MAG TPA: glycosyltransferase [Rudaea sp.]|jgi:GT2 family glycosyltransferase|nr:glycosyltransferase [Rudaea sp.]